MHVFKYDPSVISQNCFLQYLGIVLKLSVIINSLLSKDESNEGFRQNWKVTLIDKFQTLEIYSLREVYKTHPLQVFRKPSKNLIKKNKSIKSELIIFLNKIYLQRSITNLQYNY